MGYSRFFPSLSLIILLLPLSSNAQMFDEYWRHFVKYEGLRLNRYYVRGEPHIGVEHKITKHEHFRHIEIDMARELFRRDLDCAVQIVRKNLTSFDEQPEQIRLVLVDLAFNVGDVGFRKFIRFRECINKFDYFGAAKELAESRRSQQVSSMRTAWAIQCLTYEAVQIK